MSAISGIGSLSSMTYGVGARGNARPPDPATMAKNLLSDLDSDGNGTLAASELQAALEKMSSANGDSSVASTDEVFSAIDADEDGEVTKSELTNTLQTLADSIGFAQGMGGGPGGPGGMENDAGFTEEELTSQLAALNEAESLTEEDAARAELLTNVLSQFETADADGDGRVTFQEAMTLEQSSEDAATANVQGGPGGPGGPRGPGGPGGPGGMGGPPPSEESESDASQIIAAADTNEDGTVSLEEFLAYSQSQASSSEATDEGATNSTAVMRTIMQLMQSYGSTDQTNQTSQMSVSA